MSLAVFLAFVLIFLAVAVTISRYSKKRRQHFTKNTLIKGKIVIITGANSGIGKAIAVDLARREGKIYIACRNSDRALKALEEIKKESGSENVHFVHLDLASMASVREFSKKFHSLESRLDILVNNAGILACPRTLTKDGIELQFATNYLGHFLLTKLLLDLLEVASPSRVINSASSIHCLGMIKKHHLKAGDWYCRWLAYSTSKLAVVLSSFEFSRRFSNNGVNFNCFHPGHTRGQLFRHFGKFLSKIIEKLLYKDPELSAQTAIRLAVDPELERVGGKYFKNCEENEVLWWVKNEQNSQWLWDESEKLTQEASS